MSLSQNYWVFGLSPSSGILKTREHNVSETASVSVFRCGGVCRINLYLRFYPSFTNMRVLSQFLLHIFLLSPSELAWSQVIKQL
jgi:hypothetical protein